MWDDIAVAVRVLQDDQVSYCHPSELSARLNDWPFTFFGLNGWEVVEANHSASLKNLDVHNTALKKMLKYI